MNKKQPELTVLDRFRGCLLGGAVGDALGAPIEFWPLEEIVESFGSDGPAELVAGDFPAGAFTDDTQMTLFVAEGLIRSLNYQAKHGHEPPIEIFLRAHWRWLWTQGDHTDGNIDEAQSTSWLTEVEGLREIRAPGNSCLSALQSGGLGTPEAAINNSKGCGGLMRVAPVGLAWPEDPFLCGSWVAALTHGHPTGWTAAGCFARILHEIVAGLDLEPAVERAMLELEAYPGHEETLTALERALAFEALGMGNSEEVECLGDGWVAEEALSIAVFCALIAPDFESALRLAVTHSGDSDSTGSITGQILGALHGPDVIPPHWLDQLELRDTVERVAEDLYSVVHDEDARAKDGTYDLKRYPHE